MIYNVHLLHYKDFLKGANEQSINVFACFDNEEVGSGTKQGAAFNILI